MTTPDIEAMIFARAAELFGAGDALGAEVECRKALALQPENRDARNLLGLLMHSQGRYGEAEQVFGKLADEQPHEPVHWMNLATVRRLAGRHDEALQAFAAALQRGPMTAELGLNLGLLHLDRKDHVSARAVLERARDLDPDDLEIRVELAEACNALLDSAAAVEALEGWQRVGTADRELLARIARLLVVLGRPDLAGPALEQVLSDAMANPRASLQLVGVLERMNRLDEARALLQRLAAVPHGGELAGDLALARAQIAARDGRHADAARDYRELAERTAAFHERFNHLFPLARALHEQGLSTEAWDTLRDAHRSQVMSLEMTAPGLLLRGATTMEIARYGCDPDDVARWDHSDAPSEDSSPIFIVAFPRSGTTLLEVTLDAHPALVSMDEQPFLQDALDGLMAAGVRYPERMADAPGEVLQSVRAAYWLRVATKVAVGPGQRLVDKNPLNLLRLPLIARLFPRSKVVLAVRDPRDVLLSCLMQHFRAPDFAMLCRDLPTLALGYRRAMDFWYRESSVLDVAVHEVKYERFVADFPAELRSLADFLALEPDPRMFDPASNALRKGFISTPSYSQVVQPVTPKSVGRHAGYAAHFGAVNDLLAPYLGRWGYG